MNGQKLLQRVIWGFLITLLLVGCSVPAAKPIPETVDEPIKITFDGKECTSSGPTELPTGEHSFVYKNLSEDYLSFKVGRFLEGKTYQDLLELQSEPGEYNPRVFWTAHPRVLGRTWNESTGEETFTFALNKEGVHSII